MLSFTIKAFVILSPTYAFKNCKYQLSNNNTINDSNIMPCVTLYALPCNKTSRGKMRENSHGRIFHRLNLMFNWWKMRLCHPPVATSLIIIYKPDTWVRTYLYWFTGVSDYLLNSAFLLTTVIDKRV